MALFSRRPKNSDDSAGGVTPPADTTPEAEDVTPEAAPAPADAVPHVNISVSTFGSVSAETSRADTPAAPVVPPGAVPARPAHLASPAAEASTRVETVPGLRDNVLLRDALAALPAQAQPTEMINVARQLLQGHVYIRVQGDARDLLAQGKSLPTSMITFKDAKYMLVYSGGAALQDAIKADGDAGTSALAQSVRGLLEQVVAGDMGGVAVDHASRPGSALLPKQLIEKALADLDPAQRIKSLLAGTRTAETPDDVAVAMTEAPLWIAARRSDDGQVGIAELRTPEGARLLEVFSHPLELLALGRGDQPVKVEPAQLAKALRSDTGLSGVIVDPAGPWIRLTRDQLHPLLIVGA